MTRFIQFFRPPLILLACLVFTAGVLAAEPVVKPLRVPEGGIQPQAAVDPKGVIHLIYFKGDAAKGDLFYVRSTDGGSTFSAPLRINSHPASAVAMGSIRGAHLALGRGGRVHVAWNGSSAAEPRGPQNASPMLYARLADGGRSFEPQRNLIHEKYGLDGGGSIAADADGNVYVGWHAPDVPGTGEANRRVWVARSSDDGKTFQPEKAAFDEPTGACGCCGMRLFADKSGSLFALYRSAREMVHRDIYLLRSDDHGTRFQSADVSPMNVAQCVMSSSGLTQGPAGVLAAWETDGQVYWGRVEAAGTKVSPPVAAPGQAGGRKHPSLAVNPDGAILLGWTEGTGWQKGGSLAWQVYDAAGRPLARAAGRTRGIPVWSFPAAVNLPDGTFVLIY